MPPGPSEDVVSYFQHKGLVSYIACGQDLDIGNFILIHNTSPPSQAEAFADMVPGLPKNMARENKRGDQFGWGFACMSTQGCQSINKCIVPYLQKNSAKHVLGIALQKHLLKPTLQWMWEQTQDAFPVKCQFMLSQVNPQYSALSTLRTFF